MFQYLMRVQDTLKWLDEWVIEKVPRADNIQADALAGIAASLPIREAMMLPIHVQTSLSIVQAARFTMIGDYLYKRSFRGPYLRCLDHLEAQYVLVKLHDGVCDNHSGGRSLAHCAYSQGYY